MRLLLKGSKKGYQNTKTSKEMTKVPRKFRRQNIVQKRKKAQKDIKAFIKKAMEQAQARSSEITEVQGFKTTLDFDEDLVLGFKKEEE